MNLELIVARETRFKIRQGRLVKIAHLCEELFGGDGDALLNSYMHELDQWLHISSASQWYHDINHIFAMVLCADKIARYEKCTIKQRRCIFIAGMFHDVLHSFGLDPDSLNVARAITFFGGSIIRQRYCSQEDVATICDMIFCTVFPFRVTTRNALENIIRIADLCMCYEKDVDSFAAGLTAEFKRQGKHITVTKEDMIDFTTHSDYAEDIAFLLSEDVIGDKNDE